MNSTIKNDNFIYKIIKQDIKNKKISNVRTRFPPEPNGYLHIGHAKSICLNFNIANYYQGTCNLRFDDTNPIKENIEYIQSIKNDIRWLGFQWNGKTRYSSQYFNQMYNYALMLIKKGIAYVDQLNKKEIREYRGTLSTPGKNSPYRNQTIKKNIELFKKMKNGELAEGSACLRAKIDMTSPFIIMRDPVLYRIIFAEHHQTKYKWNIYPTYDFAHCISDALENITHSLCTLEFQDNRQLYQWILNNLDIKKHPHQYEYSKLNLEYSVLSKRKLSILIRKKIVNGWDDPRIPTISGLRRKGYTPGSIRDFCKKIGITKQDNIIELSLLESCIKKDLNNKTVRTMAVLEPIKIIISNLSSNYKEILTIPNHPTIKQMGTHEITFSNTLYIDKSDFREKKCANYKGLTIGKEIKLRYSYILKAVKIEKDINLNIVKIICTINKDNLGKKTTNYKKLGIIHWISNIDAFPAKFQLFYPLFNIKNPETCNNFLTKINSNSLIIKQGFVQKNIKKLNKHGTFQFEREGYFSIDKISSNQANLQFNRIVEIKKRMKKNNISY